MKAIGHNLFLSGLPAQPPTVPTVSVLSPPLQAYATLHPLPEHHAFVALDDGPDAALLPELDSALRFVHRHRQQARGVLIHSARGTSRCVAVALAYLLLARDSASAALQLPACTQVTLELALLQRAYPRASPTPALLRQLAAVAQRAPINPALYAFPPADGVIHPLEGDELLRLVARRGAASAGLLLRDGRDGDCAATCARCGAPLVPDGGCVALRPEEVTVLPTRWMARCLLDAVGKLHCKCGARVGHYDLRHELATFSLAPRALRWQHTPSVSPPSSAPSPPPLLYPS